MILITLKGTDPNKAPYLVGGKITINPDHIERMIRLTDRGGKTDIRFYSGRFEEVMETPEEIEELIERKKKEHE